MRILDFREMTFPISSRIRNSVIDFSEMTVSLVALVSDHHVDGKPVIGFGFNSNGRYGQAGILRERFFPRLQRAEPAELLEPGQANFSPDAISSRILNNEKPGGHGDRSVAAGVLNMAAWDLVAKLEGKPLWQVLRQRYRPNGTANERVWVYAAGGYYYGAADAAQVKDELLGYLDLGYRQVKMKIGGATLHEDLLRIETVLDALPPGCRLAVDANGRYQATEAVQCAKALNAYDLAWFEEPVDPLDYAALEEVAAAYDGPIATGENLFAKQEVQNLLRYGRLRADRDVLQMDPVLSYGAGEYVEMMQLLETDGWPTSSLVPHGGHHFNLHIVGAFGLGGCEAYPAIFGPFGGFAAEAVVDGGYVSLPTTPGLGLEASPGLAPKLDAITRDYRV